LIPETLGSVPVWAALAVVMVAGPSNIARADQPPARQPILQQLRAFGSAS
jgi:hypothetical protein